MFKKIVGFGDSWMYGDELTNPNITATDPHEIGQQHADYRTQNCFLGQLGQHYSVPTENFGIMGGSLQSAMWTFDWWLTHEPNPESCLVLHGITNPYRFSYYNPRHVTMLDDPLWNQFVHSSWPSDEFKNLVKQQTVLTDCPELHGLNYRQAVMLFDGVAARRNINLYQFNIFDGSYELDHVPTLIWPQTNLRFWTESLPDTVKPGGHPNEYGHKLISELLIDHIESAIIAT